MISSIEAFAQSYYASANPIKSQVPHQENSDTMDTRQPVQYVAPLPPKLPHYILPVSNTVQYPQPGDFVAARQSDSRNIFDEVRSIEDTVTRLPDTMDSVIPQTPSHDTGYTIAELQQLALQHNPLLSKKYREIQATHGVWLQAGLYANPTLEIIGDDYASNGTKGKQGFAIDQEIIRGKKLQLSRGVANWEIEIAKREWQIAQQKVLNDVRALSYDLLATQYEIVVYENLVAIGDLSVKHSEMIQRSQEGSKASLLQNRIQRNESIIDLKKAIQDENNDWNQLAAMVGLPHLAKKNITDNLDQRKANLNKDLVWQNIVQSSPEYKLEVQKLAHARSVCNRENAEKIANVTLRGEYGYHVTEQESVGSFGISLPLKIHDRNQGNIRKAQSEIHAQGREIERKEMELLQRLTTQWNIYEKAMETVSLYEQHILPDAKEAVDISIQMTQHGEASQLELFIAQRTYNTYLVNYTEALRELAKSVAYLEGFLLEGGLAD